jgi:hypothetical protein
MVEGTRQTQGKSRDGGRASGPAVTRSAAAAPRSRGGAADPLAVELRALRATLDEVVRQFHVRIGGQLAAVQRAIAGSGVAAARAVRPRAKVRAAMLREVRALKVKPRKGRTKDVVRLANLIEELFSQLPG